MIELIRHTLGFCGEHWHPNIWTAFAASPFIATTTTWLKKPQCNKHKNDYKNTTTKY
jgi:hypothetical protein